MPPLCLHLRIAREAAHLLRSPTLDRDPGGYALGATLPDVHIITKLKREETHFFDLESAHYVSGTKTMFDAHPHLASTEELDRATRSVVAGYLSHLITDEIWILEVYRPFFGSSSPLAEDGMARMFDKLMQYELDRREREASAEMQGIRQMILASEPANGIGFIANDALTEWRDFVAAASIREPNLRFFPYYARAFLLRRMNLNPDEVERFLSSMEANLEWVINYVSPARLDAFRQKAVSLSVALAKEYLREDS